MDKYTILGIVMKIGIVTYWSSSDNYGQLLQCYALQRFLTIQGHDVFLIRYLPENKKNIWEKLRNFIYSKNKKKYLTLIYELYLEIWNRKKNKDRRFSEFREACIVSTKKIYRSIQDLRSNPPIADVYVCGSDQIWNNSLNDENAAGWYLDFGNVRKIAYAPSFGREVVPSEYEFLKKYLGKIDKIGVRESSGKKICDMLGIADSRVVVDPTLLLNGSQYEMLMNNYMMNGLGTKRYVFMYFLNVKRKEEIFWNQMNSFFKQHDLDVKYVNASGYVKARSILRNVKPLYLSIPEWLMYLKWANCVLTNSFHGVVFSLLFHKPFIAVLLENEYLSGNARIVDLLKNLNIEYLIYDKKEPFEKQMRFDLNWNEIDSKLAKMIEESKLFLLMSIEENG